jgi:hypothetical protein
MCRNIRVLHHFEPPTTEEEMRAAALQYVRKVTGIAGMPANRAEVLVRAIDEITASTKRLLAELPARGEPRTREGEKERAKARWKVRVARMEKS